MATAVGTMATATTATSTVVDINLIHRLTNLNEINRLLHETLAKERNIDAELDKLLSKRADLERSFLLLNTPTAEMLELVAADCEQLLSSVQGTASMADHISSKVRRLDLVQGRVQDTLGKINLILDRTHCINGVQAAMDSEDYESAAGFISTFLDLEAKLSGSSSAVVDMGQAEEQRQVLMDAKAQLEEVVDRRFDDAVNRRDHTAVLRFTKLYKPLGKQSEGLRRFIEYLRLVVGATARGYYQALSEHLEGGAKSGKADFATTLSQLFKDLALTLEQHEALVKATFGAEAVLEVVAGLQAECDGHGTRVLQRYLEARRVDKMVKEASGRRGQRGADSSAPGSGLDHRAVEGQIDELLRLCQLSEEYCQFMVGKMREAVAPQPLSPVRETGFRSGAFCVAVRELLGHYMALEEAYMNETVAMAVRIDELVGDQLTSSMVDDTFFILRKCGVRALASGNVQCVCALLAELNNVLANSFRNALQAKLQGGPAKLMAGAPEGGATPAPGAAAGAHEYSVALNNMDVSADYVGKLRGELEGLAGEVFAAAVDRDKVRSVVADLSRTASELRQMSTKALEGVAEAAMPRLRPLLEEVAVVSYQLSESEYAANEAEEDSRWVARLLASLAASLQWTNTLLTSNNYEGLLHLVLDKVVARLEAVLARKPFNQLGGLQLDRDVRLMVSSLSELSSRTVRDKFARLSQMALLLGLEGVEEMMDYWGDDAGHITWRLSPAEVRQVLSQRADFSKDAIMALPL